MCLEDFLYNLLFLSPWSFLEQFSKLQTRMCNLTNSQIWLPFVARRSHFQWDLVFSFYLRYWHDPLKGWDDPSSSCSPAISLCPNNLFSIIIQFKGKTAIQDKQSQEFKPYHPGKGRQVMASKAPVYLHLLVMQIRWKWLGIGLLPHLILRKKNVSLHFFFSSFIPTVAKISIYLGPEEDEEGH